MDTARIQNKASRIDLFSLKSVQMRTFHMTWAAFFLAFFGWFGIAPLMAIVREDLDLTKAEVGNTIIASVAITIIARLVIGFLSDRYGPRRTYTGLLLLGSLPVMGIGLAQSYETFLLFRLGIGVIGASFVITQYHTSVMFGPNVVGTANATTAGWGNLGGGVTQMVMPLVLTVVIALGVGEALGWRVAMIVPGIALFVTGIAYYRVTRDAPDGDFHELRATGMLPSLDRGRGAFWSAARDHRVWALFLIYGACFGIELTINNVAALYFHDRFAIGVGLAGVIAGLFGLMNIFARTMGGFFGDRAGIRFGLRGRVLFLGGRAVDGRSRADVLLAHGCPAAGDTGHAGLQCLRADVGGGDLFGSTVHQPQGARHRCRHRRRRGQRGRGGGGVLVPHGRTRGPGRLPLHGHGGRCGLEPGPGGALHTENRGARTATAARGVRGRGRWQRPPA